MASVGNVILSINSRMGPGGLASLQSGIQMVSQLGGAVLETVKELDSFSSVLKRVDMGIINYADSAAKGQIDTKLLMQQLSLLNKAAPQLKITAEQFKIMSVRALNFAQATGQSVDDVFERMTSGIARAESEALKPFGIKLKESANMITTQTSAVKQLTEGYEDLTGGIETSTEVIKQIDNSWRTFTGLLWSKMETFELTNAALKDINDTLSGMNALLSSGTDSMESYGVAVNNITAKYDLLARAMNAFRTMTAAGGAAGMFYDTASEIVTGKKGGMSLEDIKDAEIAQLHKGDRTTGSDTDWFDAILESEISGIESDIGSVTSLLTKTQISQLEEWKKKQQGGGRGDGVSPYDGFGVSRNARLWAEALGIEISKQNEKLLERLGVHGFAVGNEVRDPSTGPETTPDMNRSWDGVSDRVDKRIAEAEALQDQGDILSLLRTLQWEYNEEINRGGQFVRDFRGEWENSFEHISAGASTARATFNVMQASYEGVVAGIVDGSKTIGQAMLEAIAAEARGMAVKEGMYGIQDTLAAASAFARRQYITGSKLAASAAAHYVFAGLWAGGGYLARKTAEVTGSKGGTAATPSVGRGQYQYETDRDSFYSPSYAGGGGGGGRVEYVIRLDDGATSQMFTMVEEENGNRRRAGQNSFRSEAA